MLRKLLIVPVTMKITAFKNYFTSAARSLLCDVMACLVAANGLLVALCGFFLLWSTVSRVCRLYRLQCTSLGALGPVGSELPNQGLNLCPLHWKADY